MAPPFRRSPRAAEVLAAWLASDERPGPLDRALSKAKLPPEVARRVSRLAFWCLPWLASRGEAPASPSEARAALRAADLRPLEDWERAGEGPRGLASAQDEARRCLAAGVPLWWVPEVRRRARWSLSDWLGRLAERPPLWAWGRPGAAQSLRAEGFQVLEEHGALRIEGDRPVGQSRAWREGSLQIQDLASQAVARALAPQPGQIWWDATAGAGGKTLWIAEALGGRGAVYATDRSPERLDEARRRVRRAGLTNVRLRTWSLGEPPPIPAEARRRGGFDGVLLDAPCSGSGTWRRNPDARLRPPHVAPQDYADLQARLFNAVVPTVRPGGRLVYATCSVFPTENEDLVQAVLPPGWSLEDQALEGSPRWNSDTLFWARLSRG